MIKALLYILVLLLPQVSFANSQCGVYFGSQSVAPARSSAAERELKIRSIRAQLAKLTQDIDLLLKHVIPNTAIFKNHMSSVTFKFQSLKENLERKHKDFKESKNKHTYVYENSKNINALLKEVKTAEENFDSALKKIDSLSLSSAAEIQTYLQETFSKVIETIGSLQKQILELPQGMQTQISTEANQQFTRLLDAKGKFQEAAQKYLDERKSFQAQVAVAMTRFGLLVAQLSPYTNDFNWAKSQDLAHLDTSLDPTFTTRAQGLNTLPTDANIIVLRKAPGTKVLAIPASQVLSTDTVINTNPQIEIKGIKRGNFFKRQERLTSTKRVFVVVGFYVKTGQILLQEHGKNVLQNRFETVTVEDILDTRTFWSGKKRYRSTTLAEPRPPIFADENYEKNLSVYLWKIDIGEVPAQVFVPVETANGFVLTRTNQLKPDQAFINTNPNISIEGIERGDFYREGKRLYAVIGFHSITGEVLLQEHGGHIRTNIFREVKVADLSSESKFQALVLEKLTRPIIFGDIYYRENQKMHLSPKQMLALKKEDLSVDLDFSSNQIQYRINGSAVKSEALEGFNVASSPEYLALNEYGQLKRKTGILDISNFNTLFLQEIGKEIDVRLETSFDNYQGFDSQGAVVHRPVDRYVLDAFRAASEKKLKSERLVDLRILQKETPVEVGETEEANPIEIFHLGTDLNITANSHLRYLAERLKKAQESLRVLEPESVFSRILKRKEIQELVQLIAMLQERIQDLTLNLALYNQFLKLKPEINEIMKDYRKGQWRQSEPWVLQMKLCAIDLSDSLLEAFHHLIEETGNHFESHSQISARTALHASLMEYVSDITEIKKSSKNPVPKLREYIGLRSKIQDKYLDLDTARIDSGFGVDLRYNKLSNEAKNYFKAALIRLRLLAEVYNADMNLVLSIYLEFYKHVTPAHFAWKYNLTTDTLRTEWFNVLEELTKSALEHKLSLTQFQSLIYETTTYEKRDLELYLVHHNLLNHKYSGYSSTLNNQMYFYSMHMKFLMKYEITVPELIKIRTSVNDNAETRREIERIMSRPGGQKRDMDEIVFEVYLKLGSNRFDQGDEAKDKMQSLQQRLDTELSRNFPLRTPHRYSEEERKEEALVAQKRAEELFQELKYKK